MASGSRTVRICICEGYAEQSWGLRAPRLSCPVCQLWLAITRVAHSGEAVSLARTAERVLAEPRLFGRPKGWKSAEKMDTHSLRGGAARPIREAGSSFSQRLRPVHWRSSACKLYLGSGQGGSQFIATILIEASGDEHYLVMLERSDAVYRYEETPKQ